MKQRFTNLDDPEWQELFRGVESSWFRLETLQAYDVAYESQDFEEFRRSGTVDAEPEEWQRMISSHVAAGRCLQRVHVVQEPLTDYIRYEFTAYSMNGRAGEDIRIIPTTEGHWPTGLPHGRDFWLFDNEHAWLMDYDAFGRFLAAERVNGPAEIDACRRWRDTALAQSMPLANYLNDAA